MAPKVTGFGIMPPKSTAEANGMRVSVFSGSLGPGKNSGDVTQVSELTVDATAAVRSSPSINAFHSTLFEDFSLRAESVYNFFTQDEQTNFDLPPSASLDQLPRYVLLTWNAVPTREVLTLSRKGLRPVDPRPRPGGVKPIMTVSDAKKAVANGYISPGSISMLLVPPVLATPTTSSFHEDLFLSSPSAAGRSAYQSLDHVAYHATSVPQDPVRIRANLIDPSISGMISPERIAASTDHSHIATLGALSKLIPGLEVLSEFNQDVPPRNPTPRFPAPPTSPTLRYVGYVLERHTLLNDGSMVLDRTIDIDDISVSSFVDRQVLYGARYSYRIRAIVQWSHPPDIGFSGKSTLDRFPNFNAAGSGMKQASFYSGDWSDWSRTQVLDTIPPDPPEEIYVRPISPKGAVDIVWKVPGDPQRDLSAIRLVRAVSSPDGIGDWTLLGEFVPGNGRYSDRNVSPFESGHASYIYAMYSVSYHGEISVLSDQFEARLTGRSRFLGEEPIRRVAPKGSDPMAHAAGFQGSSLHTVIASSKAVFYCRGGRSTTPLFRREYVVEVQSLSTGDRAEVSLVLDSTDVDHVPNVIGGRGNLG